MIFPPPFSGLFAYFWWVPALITILVHVAFAVAVLQDAESLSRTSQRRPFLVGGPIWALATLGGGVLVAAAYWLVHYSTLSQATSRESPSASSMGARPGNL